MRVRAIDNAVARLPVLRIRPASCRTNGWRCVKPTTACSTMSSFKQVSMFRAEMIDSDHLWLCCYLPDTGVANDRIAFAVTAVDGYVRFEVVEMPDGQVSVEPPSP